MSASPSPRLARWCEGSDSFMWRGQRLFVKDEGHGPPVLLLHGYPTGSWDWHAMWPLLRPHHRLIAPDLPGLGFSDKPRDGAYALADHAAAIDALLEALCPGAVHVVAHDLGVRVAQEMLARREALPALPPLASLVLLNGAMCPEAYRPRPIQRLLATPLGAWLGPRVPRAAFDRAIASLFGPDAGPTAELLDDFWALLEHGEGRRITHRVGRFWRVGTAQRERLVGALRRSLLPLRLINGAADPNSGAHMVQRWLELAPGTDVIRLERIGHWPQLEAPQATAAAVLDFVRRAEAAKSQAPSPNSPCTSNRACG